MNSDPEPLSPAVSPGFAIEGPSQAKIECEDQNDGSCEVRYWPTEPGEYAIRVTCDEEDIEHSPFMAYIIPDDNTSHPDKVTKAQNPVMVIDPQTSILKFDWLWFSFDMEWKVIVSGFVVLGPGLRPGA